MEPLEFLELVWSPPGKHYYCIAIPEPKPRTGYKHMLFETITAAARFCVENRNNHNIFFAVHVLRDTQIWNEHHHKHPDTKAWVAGWSKRTHANMKHARSLFFDLDVDPDNPKKYASQQEAAIALREFCRSCEMPRPLVVSSGGGLHVHWIGDRVMVSGAEWKSVADRLRRLGRARGLKLDPMRTTDESSVLRVAGTFNLKKGGKRPVEAKTLPEPSTTDNLIHLIDAALARAGVPVERSKALVAKVAPIPGLEPNVAPPDYGPPPGVDTVHAVCAQARRWRDIDKATLSEPEWYNALGVYAFTTEGDEAAHLVSQTHPNYSYDTCQAKIDHRKSSAGPTGCRKIEQDSGDPGICMGCPFRSHESGPIPLARKAEQAPAPKMETVVEGEVVTIELPDPPAPYKRDKSGGIQKLVEKEDRSWYETIFPHDLYPVDRTAENGQREVQHWQVHLPLEKPKMFHVDAGTFADARALRTAFYGLGIYPSKAEEVQKYMTAYIAELQKRRQTSLAFTKLGWTPDFTKFVLPHGVVDERGKLTPATFLEIGPEVDAIKGPEGTKERQVELMYFFNRPEYAAQKFVITAGLASAIFWMTGHAGVIVSAYGESGGSKTTSLMTAASFWGRPEIYVDNWTTRGGTGNYNTEKEHMFSSLPYCADEVTFRSPEEMRGAAINVSQYKTKGRLGRDGHFKKAPIEKKSNISLYSSNNSLQAVISNGNWAGDAVNMRVFEVFCPKPGVHEGWEAEAFLRDLMRNFGWIGQHFIQQMMPVREKVKNRVESEMVRFARRVSAKPEERLYVSLSAAVLVALDLANRLGLLPFDLVSMETWLIDEQLPQLRSSVQEEAVHSSPVALLTTFLQQVHGNLLLHDSKQVSVYHSPHGAMLGQYDLAGTKLHVLRDGFIDWCKKRSIYAGPVLRGLAAAGIVELDRRVTLGAGTNFAKGQANCFTIDMRNAAVAADPIVVETLSPNVIRFKQG